MMLEQQLSILKYKKFLGDLDLNEAGLVSLVQADYQMQSSGDSGKVDLSEWESVTLDKAQWTILIRQLEDLLALQCLLNMKPAREGLISKPAWEPEPVVISVKKVLDGGKGGAFLCDLMPGTTEHGTALS